MSLKLIYVINDDLNFLDQYKEMLELEGFKCRVFFTGKNVIQKILLSPPDLILLDLNMNDISGVDIAIDINESHKLRNIPVIILSAYISPLIKKELNNMFCIKDCLSKTEKPDIVLNTIDKHLK